MAKKKKGTLAVIPDFKTVREMIEYGHLQGGDDLQYIYLETRHKERRKTFDEVWYDTTGLGQYLYKNGVHEKKVAILSDNSYYWVACFYSIMTGRNVLIPLDPKLTNEDLVDIMVRSQCDAIYYSDDFADAIEMMKASDKVVIKNYIRIADFYDLVEEGQADLKAGSTSYLEFPPAPEDLATIVFTSGTTGRSKGVMLSHKNLTANAVATARGIEDCTGVHAIGFLPMNHLFAWASALFMSNLFHGWGYICRSLKDIPEDMKKYHPMNLAGVPLLAETIYKSIWRKAAQSGREEKLKKGLKISNFLRKHGIDVREKLFKEVLDGVGGELEYIVCAGAYLDPVYEKGLTDLGIEIFGAYGTTECAPSISVNTLRNHKFGSCGRAIECCEVKINNPDEEGVGEIYVRGDNVMLGYYEDPEATASVFDGDWFKTGDFGRMDEDGYIYFVGRKKNLIVLSNGKNIAPEELEDQLNKIEYVKEVIVYKEDDFITAEFYLDEELPERKEQIKKDVDEYNKTIAVYKRIRQIKTRDTEFPKTTTLKIKRDYKEPVKS